MGTVMDIGQPDGGVGSQGALVQDDADKGTHDRIGHGDGSTSTGPGNSVVDGQAMDITGQALGAGGSDDGVGDGSRSYTSNSNDGVRPRRYTSGHNDGSRPSGEVSSRDGRQPPRAVRRRQAVPRSTTSRDEPLRASIQDKSDGAAIAGDPMSSTHLRDRPQPATRLPNALETLDCWR